MDLANIKKGICTLKLEKLKKVYNSDGQIDDSLINAVFSIIDFSVSGNKQVVPKDVCLASAYTLKFKPLLCQYFETTDFENPNDDFGTHGNFQGKLRNGEDYIFTNTHAIGVSEKEGFLGVIKDENENDIDVLLASFMLWTYRYPNEISLINEFYEKGEPLYTSCEYYYGSSIIKVDENGNKYEEVTGQIIFDGHCCLGRGIAPAYDSSKLISFNTKWNKALNEKTNSQGIQNQETDIDINNKTINQKEENSMTENKFYKTLCELSYGDVKELIMTALSKTMSADEFYGVWLSNYGIYDTYFVYENYEGDKYVYYKVPYTKTGTDVSVDLTNKVQVMREDVWVEVGALEKVQNSLNEANNKIKELEISINAKDTDIQAKDVSIKELNSTITTLTGDKNNLSTKFEEATNSITELSKQVNEMKPIVDTYNAEKIEQALNEKKALYEEKFKAVNAKEKFDTEDVQNLIKLAINDNEEGKNAINSLNSIIADSVVLNNKDKEIDIKETAKSTNNLIDVNLSFEKRYGFVD